MGEQKSKVGWIVGGVLALLFGGFIFYLYNPRWFGERFIHFGGSVTQLQPLDAKRLLVLEHVETGGGEDGPMTVGDRWRVVETATGKVLVGPFFVDPLRWATILGDRFVLVTRHGELEIRDLHNALLANLTAFKDAGTLRHQANDLELSEDGVVTAMSEDGRLYALDVQTLKATPIAKRGDAARQRAISSASVSGLTLVGRPRAKVNDHGTDFLEPEWLADPATGKAIAAADGFVLLHYQRMYGSKEGRGPTLSAVNARGDERWRQVLAFPYLRAVMVAKEQLIIGLDEHDEQGPGSLRAIRLADGSEGWRLQL